jgi:hypothetical protein
MKSTLLQEELWIGLAKIDQSSSDGLLGDVKGTYTNAIAIADSRANFRSKVKQALADLDLQLVRLEDAETLKTRLSRSSVDPELERVAEATRISRQVGFGTFHAF